VQTVLRQVWQQYLPLRADDALAGQINELQNLMETNK